MFHGTRRHVPPVPTEFWRTFWHPCWALPPGSATWVLQLKVWNRIGRKGLLQGCKRIEGRTWESWKTLPSRSDAGLVHFVPEPGELGSTSGDVATNLQDSSSDAPCRRAQLCPNCSPPGAGYSSEGSVQQRIWSPLLLLLPVSTTINASDRQITAIYLHGKYIIRSTHALKGADIPFFMGRTGRESPKEQQWQR